MKTFEMSCAAEKNGRRHFKLVMHEIYPESAFNADGTATMTNRNGISWREKWVAENIGSVEGTFLRAEFSDKERTSMLGHGMTGFSADNMPEFCDATTIGVFTNAEIVEIVDDDGNSKKVLVGEGEIDALCYPALVEKLDKCLEDNTSMFGSVEILKTKDNDQIIYEYGYNEDCRIPKEYIYSGYCLLGVTPADDSAVLLELNEETNKEENTMNEEQIKKLIADTVSEMLDASSKVEKAEADAQEKIDEANEQIESVTAEKNEATANAEKIQSALEDTKKELDDSYKKIDALYAEIKKLNEMLTDARVKERLGELKDALSNFSEEEVAYAEAEIEEFKSDPVTSEVNAVVSKIYEGIGKNAKSKSAAIVSEQNAAASVTDIFSEVDDIAKAVEDTNIF